MEKIELIFRKRNPDFFSIERVFSLIEPYLASSYSLLERELPCYSSSVLNVIRNLFSPRSGDASLFHVTGDVHYAVLRLPRNRTILTIHDTVFMQRSRGLKKTYFLWFYIRLPVRWSRIVTTISEKSKNEILSYTGCLPSKIIVIPDPVNDNVKFPTKAFEVERPRILFVGTTPNKNLDRVIEALKGIPCELVIVGKLSNTDLNVISISGISLIHFRHLTDEEMKDQYSACDIVLFPSTYEGFGLPILEGQSARRPVITSNISPMNEVAGGGACLVDPLDISSIRDAVIKVTEDALYREKLVQIGSLNVRRFEPQKIANQYIELYKRVLSQTNAV